MSLEKELNNLCQQSEELVARGEAGCLLEVRRPDAPCAREGGVIGHSFPDHVGVDAWNSPPAELVFKVAELVHKTLTIMPEVPTKSKCPSANVVSFFLHPNRARNWISWSDVCLASSS